MRSTKAPTFSDQQIREIAARKSHDIAEWAQSTARQHGIIVRRMPNYKFVKGGFAIVGWCG
jgi:hypothetical protein